MRQTIAAEMSIRLPRPSSLLLCLALVSCAGKDAPAPAVVDAAPFNQLAISGNACGPAALLNAFRHGNSGWRALADTLPGDTDKSRLSYTIRAYGLRPSGQLRGRTRWSRAGINVTDLTDLGNDLASTKLLPPLRNEVLLPHAGESPDHLALRVHDTLSSSLSHGLPPVVSVRRQVLRTGTWITVESHFITVLRVGTPDPAGMTVDYIDPWGGRRCTGHFKPSSEPALGLETDLPATPVGRRLVHPGEETLVTVSAAIGRW